MITIIGVLMALLLPAIQAAREAARRLQCKNHVKQLATAALTHEEAIGHLPTGGWFAYWPPDADRGFDRDQPGGWAYNVLPFLEETTLHDLPGDGRPDAITQEQLDRAIKLMVEALPILYCPSRRTAIAYPPGDLIPRDVRIFPTLPRSMPNAYFPRETGKLDYAINGGEASAPSVGSGSPSTIAEAESSSRCVDGLGNLLCSVDEFDDWVYQSPLTGEWGGVNGVSFRRSEVSLRHVTDGASKTYLIGEKFRHQGSYRVRGDYLPWCNGTGEHNTRWGTYPPEQDWLPPDFNASTAPLMFGSAHSYGFHMAFCDGSVRVVAYDVDPLVHAAGSNRKDGAAYHH